MEFDPCRHRAPHPVSDPMAEMASQSFNPTAFATQKKEKFHHKGWKRTKKNSAP
jgi:hypothetical protein